MEVEECCAHPSRTFGGKSAAAAIVWGALGRVSNYVGSASKALVDRAGGDAVPSARLPNSNARADIGHRRSHRFFGPCRRAPRSLRGALSAPAPLPACGHERGDAPIPELLVVLPKVLRDGQQLQVVCSVIQLVSVLVMNAEARRDRSVGGLPFDVCSESPDVGLSHLHESSLVLSSRELPNADRAHGDSVMGGLPSLELGRLGTANAFEIRHSAYVITKLRPSKSLEVCS